MLFYLLDVTFSTKVWWTAGFPDFMFGGLKYSIVFTYLRTGTVVLELTLLVFTRKGGSPYVDD